jgi:hypothetical protein
MATASARGVEWPTDAGAELNREKFEVPSLRALEAPVLPSKPGAGSAGECVRNGAFHLDPGYPIGFMSNCRKTKPHVPRRFLGGKWGAVRDCRLGIRGASVAKLYRSTI